jgi:hypothetical protein
MFFRVYNGNWQRWVQVGGGGLETTRFNPNKEGHRLSANINIYASTNLYARLMDKGDIGKTYKFWGDNTVAYYNSKGSPKTSTLSNKMLFLTCLDVNPSGIGSFSAELKNIDYQ